MSRQKNKIAIIGPEDIISDCLAFEETFPLLTFVPMMYKEEEEINAIIADIDKNICGAVFAGSLPYFRVENIMQQKKIPSIFIPFNGIGLLKALLEMETVNSMRRVSLDTVDKSAVIETFEEIDYWEMPQHLFEFENVTKLDTVIDYHKRLHDQKLTDVAITSVGYCYKELIQQGVPSIRIKPSRSAIKETLEKMELICDNQNDRSNLLAVGIIFINETNELVKNKSAIDFREIHLQFEHAVLKFAKTINSHYLNTSPGEIQFYTSWRTIDEITANMTNIPSELELVYGLEGISVSIGIGFGTTTNFAIDSAGNALNKAKQIRGNVCLILDENYNLIGPLGEKTIEQSKIRSTNERVQQLALEAGISSLTLSKIIDASVSLNNEFTSRELAPFLGVTIKSTQRVLRKLQETKFIEIVGKESIQAKGKPRTIYKIREELI